MGITGWDVYWITRLDGLSTLCGGMLVLAGVALFLTALLGPMVALDFEGGGKYVKRIVVAGCVMLPLGAIGLAFIPTTKEMCAILVIPRIANSETTEKLGAEIVGLAEAWLKELRPSEEKGK